MLLNKVLKDLHNTELCLLQTWLLDPKLTINTWCNIIFLNLHAIHLCDIFITLIIISRFYSLTHCNRVTIKVRLPTLFIIVSQARCSMETTRFETGSARYEAAALHLCYLARCLFCFHLITLIFFLNYIFKYFWCGAKICNWSVIRYAFLGAFLIHWHSFWYFPLFRDFFLIIHQSEDIVK